MKEKVALLKCTTYDISTLEDTIRHGFDLLGGDAYLKELIPPGSKLMLKPNMLSVEKPGSIVVTNHQLFEAAIRVFKDYASTITFGDSPGFGSSRKAAEKSGLLAVAERYGVAFAPFEESVEVSLEEAILCKKWDIAKDLLATDVLISLPKLKTHGMAYYTGAIKNQFGCIPGTQKAQWHTRMPQAENFCKMLLDLNTVVGTDFAILDGIVAMQGNGPKSGDPYNLNALLMGESLSALDSVAVQLIGYDDPLETPLLKEVYDYGWGAVTADQIEVIGEKLDDMKVDDFELIRKGGTFHFISPAVTEFLRPMIAPYPSLIEEKCISCNRCVEVCPEDPKAVVLENGKPVWDLKKCIRCFCCQELCPAQAIEVKTATLGKLLNRL